MDEENLEHVYPMEYYPAIKNEIIPFAATGTDLQIIVLSEVTRQKKTNTVCFHLYVESKK